MSSQALHWAMHTETVTEPVDRLILIYLADGADEQHRAIFNCDDETLQRWTNLSDGALWDAAAALAQADVIGWETVGGGPDGDQTAWLDTNHACAVVVTLPVEP